MTSKITPLTGTAPTPGIGGRMLALLYGVASYIVFFATFLYTVGFVADRVVPQTIDRGPSATIGEALIVDALLLLLFAIQHSVMARPRFKAWWTRYIPPAIERSTYVLFATASLALLLWQWRPIPGVVWHFADPLAANILLAISLCGWLIALASTFLINHFELFGLQQVGNNLTGTTMPTPRFRTPLLYRFVRHPLYLGFIIAFWIASTMTIGHLLFAGGMTVYILVGILFEERDLVDLFGDEYRQYKERVAMLVPRRARR